MNRTRKTVGILIGLLAVSLLVLAPLAPAADPVESVGVVALEDNIFVLNTDTGKYLLDGIDESLEGKKVKVVGTVETGADGNKWIVVESAEPVQ